MQNILRHSGVFVLVLVLASLTAFFGPLTWSVREVFLYYLLGFLAYLAISMLIQSRGAASKE
jgi:hypothetical protein